MFEFSSGSKKSEVVAIVDIGSASIGAAFLKVHSDAPSEIIWSRRLLVPSADREKPQVLSAIATALSQISAKGTSPSSTTHTSLEKPHKLYAVVHAPWAKSLSFQTEELFEKDEKISAAMIEKASQKSLKDLVYGKDTELLEANVMRVELNGHPSSAPIGKLARELTVHILATQIETSTKKVFADALRAVFPALQPIWRSHIRSVISFTRENPAFPKDCCVIDMTNEGTTISVVRNNMLSQQITVSEGIDRIVSELSPKGLPEETLGLLRMLERDQCAGGMCDEIKSRMGSSEPELVRRFAAPLGKLAEERPLPNKILLFTHPDLLGWLGHFFSRLDFAQFTITAQPFSVSTISPKDLERWVLSASGTASDSSILLASALVHNERQVK